MAGKVIFITGGGSGIGRAVAQRFAREGWGLRQDVRPDGLRRGLSQDLRIPA